MTKNFVQSAQSWKKLKSKLMKIIFLGGDDGSLYLLKNYFKQNRLPLYSGEKDLNRSKNSIHLDPHVIVRDVEIIHLLSADLSHLLRRLGNYAKKMVLISSQANTIQMMNILKE